MGVELSSLVEGNTFPSELYHVTNHMAASKIVRENSLKLTFANGMDFKINKDKFFYLSMSYDKWGRYTGSDHRSLGSKVYQTNTILVMDSKALQQKGKLIDVDYWESESYENDEREVRFISNKQILSDAKKFVNEIHILVPEPTSLSPEIRERSLKNLLLLERSDFNVYFYNDPKAFKLTLKSKSASKVSDVISRQFKVTRKEKHGRYGSHNNVWKIIHLIRGTDPETDRYNSLKSLRQSIEYTHGSNNYHYTDAVSTIDSDLHNAKRSHDKSYQVLVNLLIKLKLKTPSDIVDYVYDTFYAKSDAVSAVAECLRLTEEIYNTNKSFQKEYL